MDRLREDGVFVECLPVTSMEVITVVSIHEGDNGSKKTKYSQPFIGTSCYTSMSLVINALEMNEDGLFVSKASSDQTC
jgi:hypothetical protein